MYSHKGTISVRFLLVTLLKMKYNIISTALAKTICNTIGAIPMKFFYRFKTSNASPASPLRWTALFLILLVATGLFSALDSSTCAKASDISPNALWPTGPEVSAPAAIVMEANTGTILYAKDIYTAYYPASITKVMTALLAFQNSNLNEIMTMTVDAEMNVYGSRVGLVRGESVTMESALYAVLLESANEVTYGVAEHVGGTMKDFVTMMNEKAKELGCVNTNFVNPHGLHEEGHYVCAYDMALIGREAIAIPEFRKIAGTRTYTIPATNKNVSRPMAHHHQMIHKTLPYEYAIAGKTGGTNEAKNTLITFAEKDGQLLICVVLYVNTVEQMYQDTIKLFDFCFENYTAHGIQENELGGNASFASLFSTTPAFSVTEHEPILRIDTDSSIVLPNGVPFSQAQKTVDFAPLEEFLHGDNTIGTIRYSYGGVSVGSADITYYNESYPINSIVFPELWPAFLVTPDEAFTPEYAEVLAAHLPADALVTPTPTTSPALESTEENPEPQEQDASFTIRKQLLIPVIAALLIIILVVSYIRIFGRKERKRHSSQHF